MSRFLAGGAPKAEAIDEFLTNHDFPLVEDNCVTVVYRGEAERVGLRHWIFGLPSATRLSRVKDTDLWYVSLELPQESRVEYKIELVRNGHEELILDPLNPRQATDPFGGNSVLQTHGYEVPDWCLPDAEAREGRLQEMHIESASFGNRRTVTLYIPPRFRRRRVYPVLIVHDGPDYLNHAAFKTVLDNLVYRHEIPAMIVALSHPEDRLVEYADDDRHARYLTEELIPALEADWPIARDPRQRGLMGASFGAVASLAAAYHYPGFYGRLLLQSGSFAFTDIGQHRRPPVFDPVVDFVNRFRARPERVAEKVFMSCGVYESLIYENRSIVPLLQATGMQLRFVESRDGHNWENWRDRLREGLSWLFPGPLWMVYE